MAGSDITYKCTTTPGIFEVILVVYRDCSGTPICTGTCGSPCSQTMNIQGADPSCQTTTFGNFSLQLVSVRDAAPELACPNAKNECTNMGCVTPGTFSPSIERYEFRGFANVGPTSGIPTTCCNVRFSWSLCCRSSSINTGAANQNFYVDAVINRCYSVSPCNSSPELSSDPFALICPGEPYVFNNGAIDPDFDSLSFAFTPALIGFGISVTYNPPYAADRPMPWTGSLTAPFPSGISCNPFTGDILFTSGNTSGQNFTGVMAIEIKQWKPINGIPTVIGITRRDIQMVVLANCVTNKIPKLITNPTSLSNPNEPRTNWEVCAGEQLCFTVTAQDSDFTPPSISDTTKLTWNASIASLGATFVKNYSNSQEQRKTLGPREDQWRFCWTPDDSLASNTPYYINITGKDQRCPKPGRITRAFSIKVLPKAAVTIAKSNLSCGQWQLSYNRDLKKRGGKPGVLYNSVIWKVSRVPNDSFIGNNPYQFNDTNITPAIQLNEPGKYLVQLTIAAQGPYGIETCSKVFYDTINNHSIKVDSTLVLSTIIGNTSVLPNSTHEYQVNPKQGIFNYWTVQNGTILSNRNTNRVSVKWGISGTGNLEVRYASDSLCFNKSSIAVSISSVGVEEKSMEMGLEIFPNPTNDLLNIQVLSSLEDQTLYLMDFTGKLILQQTLKHNQQLDLSEFASGIYMLRIGNWYGQIIKE